MIKQFITVFFIVSFTCSLEAQDTTDIKINLRHISGFKALDIVTGMNKFGKYMQFGYSYYINNRTMFQSSVSWERGKINIAGYDDIFLHAGMSHTVYKIKEFCFINIHYCGLLGVENNKNTYLDKSESLFDYGGGAGGNIELFLTDRIALLLNFDEYYRLQNKFGKFHFHAGAGLRIFVQ